MLRDESIVALMLRGASRRRRREEIMWRGLAVAEVITVA
jgi:hypothetical protein